MSKLVPGRRPIVVLAFSLIMSILLIYPALAHIVDAAWPSIQFTADDSYQLGATVFIEAETQNTDSVSWRLLRNGQSVSVTSSEGGVTFVATGPGDYVLRGVAHRGLLSTTHTEQFYVSSGGSSAGDPAFSMSLPYDTYSTSGRISPLITSSGIQSVNWTMTKDGTPAEVPPGLGAGGGSIQVPEPGSYELTAVAQGTDGSLFTETVSFIVLPDPTLSLSMETKAYVGEPHEVHLTTTNVPDDRVEFVLIRDGMKTAFSGFSSTGGTITVSEPGLYSVLVKGYDESRQVYDSAESYLLVTRRTDGEPRAGSTTSGVNRRSIFSWSGYYLESGKEAIFHEVMEMLDCDTVYQTVEENESQQVVLDYLQRRQADGHRVYYLCGHTSWALEPDAASMMRELNKVIAWNEAAREAGITGFYGILYDIEGLFNNGSMDQAVKNYKTVYPVAKEHGIKVEACISYRLDTSYGFESQLEDLVANGCDSLAVMNYYKRNTEGFNIQFELELCQKYGKELVNITEMQRVGSHNLTADQTYHDDGIDAVEQMWREIQAVFDCDLNFSYHYLNPLIELLGLDA